MLYYAVHWLFLTCRDNLLASLSDNIYGGHSRIFIINQNAAINKMPITLRRNEGMKIFHHDKCHGVR